MKTLVTILTIAVVTQFSLPSANASGFSRKCDCVGDYRPPKGVIKYWTCRVSTETEVRYHCLPCGRKSAYTVKVITYRDRFSDGSNRLWKCVVSEPDTYYGK
tara:strand:- start:556 stop:861 length:306 start_codon:yes stop_codon:yes gene_type:complete